jgi:hypothetical protein
MGGGLRGVSDARRDIRALAGQKLALDGRCNRLGGDDLARALDRAYECLDSLALGEQVIRIAGGTAGSDERITTLPRLLGIQ